MLFRALTLLLILPLTEVTGRVLDNSGKPLSGVKLEMAGSNETETDANGNFRLDIYTHVIFALKEGYVPLFRSVDQNATTLTLTMTPEGDRLEFPRCSEDVANLTAPAVLPLGNGLVTPIPKSFQHKSEDLGDTGTEHYFQPENKAEELVYSWYVKGGPDLPNPLLMLGSTEWHARSTSNQPYSTEWRGTLKNGNKWRWIYFAAVPTQDKTRPGSIWSYRHVSSRTAAVFDQILDQTCAR